MSALALAGTTTVTPPPPVHARRTRGNRLRPVPDHEPPLLPDGDAGLTLTIRIEGGNPAGRDRVLAALRDFIAAAGPSAAVVVTPAAGDAAGERVGRGGVPAAGPRAGIVLDPNPRTAARDGRPLQLSRLEYDLLMFLARHPRQVFSRGQLLEQVWGHTHTTNRTVDVHVSRLRHKLGDEDLVTTVYGVGYRLADDAPVTVAD